MNEKDGFDKIVEALQHQGYIIHRHYKIKYSSSKYCIEFCRKRLKFNILLFIDEVGRYNINKMMLCGHKIHIMLNIHDTTEESPIGTQEIDDIIIEGDDIIISAPPITRFYSDKDALKVKVTNKEGVPIVNKEVKLMYDTFVHSGRRTDENGEVYYNFPNAIVGVHHVIIAVNDIQIATSVTILADERNYYLTAHDLTKKYGESVRFCAYVTGINGEPIMGKEVVFTVNGIIYRRTTDANGEAGFWFHFMPGTYIVTSSHEDITIENTVIVEA